MKIIEVTIVINAGDTEENDATNIGRGLVNDLEMIGWPVELVKAEYINDK